MVGDQDMIRKIMGRVTACDLEVTRSYGNCMLKMDLDRKIRNTEL